MLTRSASSTVEAVPAADGIWGCRHLASAVWPRHCAGGVSSHLELRLCPDPLAEQPCGARFPDPWGLTAGNATGYRWVAKLRTETRNAELQAKPSNRADPHQWAELV